MAYRKGGFFSSTTNILIVLNVVFFLVVFPILLATNGSTVDIVAIKPANILSGKYIWTFITSMFMHANIFHLFANMFSLFFIGNLIERIVGRRRYLWFYLLSGIFASVFFILVALIFVSDLEAYAVGASGAIFGLAGLLMILTPNLPVYIMFIPIPVKMKYAVPLLLFVLWLISIGAQLGGASVRIGNTAHLGGVIAGLVYGLYLKKRYKRKVMMINKYFR